MSSEGGVCVELASSPRSRGWSRRKLGTTHLDPNITGHCLYGCLKKKANFLGRRTKKRQTMQNRLSILHGPNSWGGQTELQKVPSKNAASAGRSKTSRGGSTCAGTGGPVFFVPTGSHGQISSS